MAVVSVMRSGPSSPEDSGEAELHLNTEVSRQRSQSLASHFSPEQQQTRISLRVRPFMETFLWVKHLSFLPWQASVPSPNTGVMVEQLCSLVVSLSPMISLQITIYVSSV